MCTAPPARAVIRVLLIPAASPRLLRRFSGDPGIEVRSAASRTWSDLVAALEAFQPAVVVLDRDRLGAEGVTLAGDLARVRIAGPPGVVVLSGGYHAPDFLAAARAGVRGYVVASPAGTTWGAVVREVAAGGAWLDPRATADLLGAFRVRVPDPGRARIPLTERELTVLRLIARGCSNLEVARELGLSQSTIKTHVSRMLARLELRSRTQLAAFARDFGLV